MPTERRGAAISVLIGAKSALSAGSIPEELEPVVKQLQAALRYTHYGLMTTVVQRTKPGDGLEGSGVAEPTLLGMTPNQERPVFYSYNLRRVTVAASSTKSPAVVSVWPSRVRAATTGWNSPNTYLTKSRK